MLYLVAGAALVVLVLGIHDRLEDRTPTLARTTTAFGLIWAGLVLASGMVALVGQRAAVELAATDRAEAVSTWSAVSVVQDALGGGIEIVGALWVLLASIAALRSSALPRGLVVLGVDRRYRRHGDPRSAAGRTPPLSSGSASSPGTSGPASSSSATTARS